MIPVYDEPGVTLYHGDCIEVMRSLPDASVHAVVTDPPYGLEFMGKDWDAPWKTSETGRGSRVAAERASELTSKGKGHTTSAGPYLAAGVDSIRVAGLPFQQWCEVWAAEALRVLKPGGYMLAFGGTRTFHRLVCAIEDAGFEIRDTSAWLYGSGFPKGINLEGEWEGWGTGLKPAFEPISISRKPLVSTVAASMAEHGTGAMHIAASRVGNDSRTNGPASSLGNGVTLAGGEAQPDREATSTSGRWPANVLLDDSQAAELDSQTGILTSGLFKGKRTADKFRNAYGEFKGSEQEVETYGDSGGASRFFPTFHYEAKAPGTERPDVDGTQHPTVKPLELMRWLVRLVATPGAVILEPFAGSGTTLEACLIEGFDVIGIEREDTYLPLIMQRIRKPLQQSLFGDIA